MLGLGGSSHIKCLPRYFFFLQMALSSKLLDKNTYKFRFCNDFINIFRIFGIEQVTHTLLLATIV